MTKMMTKIMELATMSISTTTEMNWSGLHLAAVCSPGTNQTERIMAALGPATGGLPKVDEDTLARYYAYLSANLSLPFTAYYPQPANAQEKTSFAVAFWSCSTRRNTWATSLTAFFAGSAKAISR